MNCELLFPTPIFCEKISGIDLTDYIKRTQETDPGHTRSNEGGWHSSSYSGALTEFEDLWKAIEIHLNTFHRFLGMSGEVYITTLWFNVNKKNSWNVPHRHASSNYSGVYYIKTPENCGDIFFLNPNSSTGWVWPNKAIVEQNNITVDSVGLKAEKDNLYLFPSYIQHYVGMNLSDEERISLSFNTALRY